MNCNFPELLVNDLEASNSVFVAKNLTAGAPSALSLDATRTLLSTKESGLLHPVDELLSPGFEEKEDYTPAPSPGIRYHSALSQIRLLEPIDEAPALVGGSFDDTTIANGHESDWDSVTSSSHSSSILGTPCVKLRKVSVVTTASSISSGPLAPELSGCVAEPGSVAEMSWIDADSDDDEAELRSPDFPRAASAPPTTRRLTFAPETDMARVQEVDTPKGVVNMDKRPKTPAHTYPRPRGECHSLRSGTASKVWAARRRGTIGVGTGKILSPGRASSLPEDEAPIPTPPISRSYSLSTLPSRRENNSSHDVLGAEAEVLETKTDFAPSCVSIRSRASSVPLTKHTADDTPATNSNVQTWIESSIDVATKPDDQLRGIPLPPDVIDNIRISIACFPDTMLLTSSLSVETIRSYSRMVKTPPLDYASAPSSSYPHKRRGLARILSTRRLGTPESTSAGRRDSAEDGPSTPWACLRPVFDAGEDYLRDALYAHIVVYNYISALPRSRPAAPSLTRPSSRLSVMGGDGAIPKKAASLLGLRTQVLARSPTETLRVPGPPSQAENTTKRDEALRDLLVGLSRCIDRLVVALKEGAPEAAGEGAVPVDVYLARTLCEVVRCSEER
ncbi:uncharacterized protein DNG_02903 [Cephalotrichum gorgonifer]|uniref:Uncharacterized protein n=1 Tax=Cephalotrichum gorgonifer TaxID=2041049 RepID=A0AAE8MVM0_9PEZI|nr:uncharacterized protein DNG_02903 [Cephalotrichum gorgonifer]